MSQLSTGLHPSKVNRQSEVSTVPIGLNFKDIRFSHQQFKFNLLTLFNTVNSMPMFKLSVIKCMIHESFY